MAHEGKYNIKAISNMVGIQPGTLRAWERRYQILNPVRNDSGHRLYTEEDLRKLKWLTEKVSGGFTISQAVSLLETESSTVGTFEEEGEVDSPQKIRDELLTMLLSFEEGKAQDLINHAFSLYSVEKVVIDILGSLLVTVGDMWEKGQITSAHEHYTTQVLKTRISMIFYSLPSNGLLPKAIAVCGPNETHEVGLLVFTLFLRRKGFEVIYLGSSIEDKDVELIVKEVDPTFLFMSCTMLENAEKTLNLTNQMIKKFPHLKVGLGGYVFDVLDSKRKGEAQPFILGNTKEEWNSWLTKKLAEID
ncbi:MerR family transcriptional regulator [Priestia megaterium]|jgi:MerR family transcriptional regulator, light-induced transcriptional regulator|uniref:MerR family transcriptional regulator n=2 Tax=Priestia megaterium TaxID=1404 RepID=A0A6M6DUD6_PRIMG|nr:MULTISPECIES: MerR family transcriptional regulator [Priestia]AJI20494.1 merR regulatory family protein [Priestia megaterium NBRC 15308 = ATCC 14581]AYE49363.1 MerR family transcriptional regulator [Priestia megaterium NCT-2]KFN00555.1 merR regulatory family protein [Priestia megaterium]KGJ72990.1 MerR family transcriptional regulator [Priestia megaterium NBRC 15308 = ATCC 14581]KLV31152.1 MerR family transcriptional regulator [Priestia megaterium]